MESRRALISVSNKEGAVFFAQELEMMGWEIISTGGTARSLREGGIRVRDVSELTGFPEMLDGRVKTLHPKVHGGILGCRDLPLHNQQMKEQGIEAIDLVAVNLYPFPEVIARRDTTLEEAIENIDIGGPAMIRAAAKNYRHVIVVVEPFTYSQVVEELRREGDISLSTRFRLAVRAFSHTAYYDSIISNYLGQRLEDQRERLFPELVTFPFCKLRDLDSVEGSRQKAALYREPLPAPGALASGRQIMGNRPTPKTINDLHVAWELVKEFEQPAAVVVKHACPLWAALAETPVGACQKAFDGVHADTFSGSAVAFNRAIDEQTARLISRFLPEAIAAPSFSAGGLDVLSTRRSILLYEIPLGQWSGKVLGYHFDKIGGGILLREDHPEAFTSGAWNCVTDRKPTEQERRDLLFGLMVARHAGINAVAIAKRWQVLGLGHGQMDQLDSVRMALGKAGQNAGGGVMVSAQGILTKDEVEIAALQGITAVLQPGGVKGDEEVIGVCKKYNIAMLFTGTPSF